MARFVIDEAAPLDLGRVLVEMGHEAIFSVDRIGRSAKPRDVVMLAAAERAIVATWNINKVAPIVARRPPGLVGALYFRCDYPEAPTRVTAVRDVIEYELGRGGRFAVLVHSQNVQILR